MIDKDVLRRNFSKKADLYDKYARVQKHMAKQLIMNFDNRDNRKNILEVGSGTGYMTGLIQKRYDSSEIDAVDISEGMIDKIRARFESGVNPLCADIEEIHITKKYDIIASNATFQWFNDFSETSYKLLSSIKRGGLMTFSTFGQNTFKELHDSYQMAKKSFGLVDNSRLGQDFYSANDIEEILLGNARQLEGEFEISLSQEEIYQYFDSVRSFLDSVRNIGAGNTKTSSSSIKALKETMRIYENEYSENNRVRATYHCIYVTARRR